MYARLTGDGAPYNQRFVTNGVACTTASIFPPGVFALSDWDLVGALPLPLDRVSSLAPDGDTH